MKTTFIKSIFIVIILLAVTHASAQTSNFSFHPKGKFYFYWGYNRGIYSRSNIHFSGPGYDFTVYKVKAVDRPENPSLVYINPAQVSIPQFNIRMGYNFARRWAVSLGYDHMKYVMQNGQTANVSGIITSQASEKYAGTYLQKPVVLEKDFLKFEHTDGLNIITIDVEHYLPLWKSKRNKWQLEAAMGTGGFWVAPRSDLRVFGKGLNNDYHIAGYTWTGKAGLRINGFKRFFFQAETRGGYISLPSVLVANSAPDLADHNFTFLEFSGVVGVYF